jgi:hypothetical protein
MDAWAAKHLRGNIALRLPDGIIGIDVDNYEKDGKLKSGANTIAILEATLGASLPPTVVSTSRDDGVSGIRLYRVPKGMRWHDPGPGIEVISTGRRYMVVAPSRHPEGRTYGWVDSEEWATVDIPNLDGIVELPAVWVQECSGGEMDTGPAPKRDNVTSEEEAEILTDGEPCDPVRKALAKYTEIVDSGFTHHGAMRDQALALLRLGEQGHHGVSDALEQLHDQFKHDVPSRSHEVESEFYRALKGGVELARGEPTPEDKKGCCGANARYVPNEENGTGTSNRPAVNVTNPAEAADWLRNELGRGELSGVFLRENVLVHTPRIGEDGYIDPKTLGLEDAGPAQVRIINTQEIKALIETRYMVWKWQGSGDGRYQVHSLFPVPSANSACDAARIGEHVPHLRRLHGVTHTPTIRPDGTILDEPGYDPETRLLYLPDPDLKIPEIPDHPIEEEVDAATWKILEPVREFPFVSHDDRATWIGLAMTPALRPLFPPPYQMGVITATNPGTGKTLLADLLRTLHGGVKRGEMPRDKDEFRKAVSTTLTDTTAPVIIFDNLRGVVRSAELEALLTTKTWNDRGLGFLKEVHAINDRLWMATGNNAQFGGDLGRRIAVVSLNPPGANHFRRTDFTIKNLEAWMHEHRGEYLAAILTVARGWIEAGRPSKRTRSDEYADWIAGIQGLLEWARFSGTFGGGDSDVATSSDDEEWHLFLEGLHGVFEDEIITTKKIVSALSSADSYIAEWHQLDPALLPGDLAERWARSGMRDSGFRASLGHWLKNHQGRYANGWQMVGAGRDGNSKQPQYTVIPPEGQ